MKIGFIGCGNMATAIINGILNNELVNSNDIIIYDKFQGAVDRLVDELNVIGCNSQEEVNDNCDILFLAVKPNVIGDVISQIENNSPLVISIAAGKTIEYLESFSRVDLRLVRVMPNINAKVGEAISAYCYNENVLVSDINKVELILSCFGKCLYIDESQFPIFGVLGGCAPAFAYMFIDSLAQAGVDNGMTKEEALKIAAQTVYGSAKMILETDTQPWRLADNVCSPGGTTIEGDINKVELILSCFGKCLYIDESQFPIFGVLGGCAPAFAYMFIDSLAQAGVDNGMTKEEALKIAAQTVYGSAKMILETDTQPWRLADNVCSPGGTTIEGVISLQKDEFNKTIKRAVNKSFEKDKLL